MLNGVNLRASIQSANTLSTLRMGVRPKLPAVVVVLRVPSTLEPDRDLGGVESYEATPSDVGDAPFRDEPANVALGYAEVFGKFGNAEQAGERIVGVSHYGLLVFGCQSGRVERDRNPGCERRLLGSSRHLLVRETSWDQASVDASCRRQSVLASFTRPFNGGHIQNGRGHRRSRNVSAKK
jgi:hypothetical protein